MKGFGRNVYHVAVPLVLGLLCACEPLTEADLEQQDQQTTLATGNSTVTHGYHSGITPENIDQDEAWRTYPVIQADWEGPGGESRWLGRNLGAVASPSSVDDAGADAAGWYFKFNRKQGYYHRGSGDNPVEHFPPELTDDFPAEDFDSDWIRDDPCTLLLGNRWRIPTEEEWLAARDAGADLNLHKGGIINGFVGFMFDYRGTRGNYWTRNQYLHEGMPVYQAMYVSVSDEGRVDQSDHILMSMGMPVRCIEAR